MCIYIYVCVYTCIVQKMRVVVSLLGLQLAHAFCLRVPSNHVPRVSVTATVCASAHRREALGVLCTGVGLAVLAHTTSAEAKSPRQAPAESRDSVSVGIYICIYSMYK